MILQVYNERIYDLLSTGIPPIEGRRHLELKEDSQGCLFVEGLNEVSSCGTAVTTADTGDHYFFPLNCSPTHSRNWKGYRHFSYHFGKHLDTLQRFIKYRKCQCEPDAGLNKQIT